jgi:DNA helicase-2/ATP-dependent DNA helicase PcrA
MSFYTQTHGLLKHQNEIRQKYQKLYSHVLVDEFQDTNPSQMEILKLLVGNSNGNGNNRSFWICGDDWQSIFAFTGASVGNIINFNTVFPNCQQFILHVNYRSTPQILHVCQRLIEHNTRRIEKTLTTGNPDGEGVVVLAATNEEDEANQLVLEIKDLIEARGYEYKDIAILYRSNFQSRVFEEGFSKNKIPYHIENGTSFYQRREVKILLDYLRFINDPLSEEGDEALRQIINIPNRYIGRTFMEELAGYAGLKELHLYQALKTMRIDIPYIRRYVREFISIMEPLIKDARQIEPSYIFLVIHNSLRLTIIYAFLAIIIAATPAPALEIKQVVGSLKNLPETYIEKGHVLLSVAHTEHGKSRKTRKSRTNSMELELLVK